MRFFNTEGPVVAARHYCVEPLARVDFDHMLALIDWQKYFVLHAPRQTGKTSTLLAPTASEFGYKSVSRCNSAS